MTALYSTYRSQRFDDLVGQDAVVQTLKNAIVSGRVAHAYLFTGIRGTGKTSTARILAKAVNCQNPQDGEPCNQCVACVAITQSSATDLIEIDAASNRGIDEIRDLREKAKYLPSLLGRKVYIIDEAHQLTPEAFNALLKTLEEPPGHVLFILCTTEAHKLPATIISRCQRFDFRRIIADDIVARLRYIVQTETLNADDAGLAVIAAIAQGSMRDAITMLDQMASSGSAIIDAEGVRRQLGLVNNADIAALLAGAARGDAAFVLRDLDRLAQQGADMRQLTNNLAEMARSAVLVSLGAVDAAALGIGDAAAASLGEVVGSAGKEFAAAAFEAAMAASSEMKQTHDPRLLLELLLLRLSAGGGAGAPGVGTGPAVIAAPVESKPAATPKPSATPAPEGAATPAVEPGDGAAIAGDAAGDNGSGGSIDARAVTVASAPPLPAGAGLAEILSRWPSLLEELRASPVGIRVRGVLMDARPEQLDDDLLTIGMRYPIHVEKAQEPVHRQELERALHKVYGRTYRLQLQVGSAAGPPAVAGGPPPGPAPSATSQGRGGEGVVQAAQEILGARVVDVRNRETAGG